MAAKSGTPAMESLRPGVPVTVPSSAAGGTTSADVTAEPITGPSALDTKPDARLGSRQPEQHETQAQPPEAAKPAQPAQKKESKKKK
jgi:hypothetical protein